MGNAMRIVPVTRVDQTRFAILLEIFSRKLPPGARIVEAKFAEMLGVSQATVNAALQDLSAQGVVTKILNRSTNVSRYSLKHVQDLFAVRRVLEPAAAAAAAAAVDPEGLAALSNRVSEMRTAAMNRDSARFCLADYSFHQELFQQTENPFLIQACNAIAAAPFAYLLCGTAEKLRTDYSALAEDHQAIVDALRTGPDTTERVMREMVEHWLQHSINALPESAVMSGGPA